MQLDFHHAVTYVCARSAGFAHEEAAIVAHAAEFVDDATENKTFKFDSSALFHKICTSHNMLAHENLNELENLKVWMPFHFLPGNGGFPAGKNPDGKFIEKLICLPNSPVAQEMMAYVLSMQSKPYALHMLGIGMHVYADTWAHQGFAGVMHALNDVDNLEPMNEKFDLLVGLWDKVATQMEGALPKLGHAQAGVHPDMPFLKWQYKNGRGKVIERDNTADFCEAADHMCRQMQTFRGVDARGLAHQDMNVIQDLLRHTQTEDEVKRHDTWVGAIDHGYFTFGSAKITYTKNMSKNLWTKTVLGAEIDENTYVYRPGFLNSNLKRFYDAANFYRVYVVHELLPKYGICAA